MSIDYEALENASRILMDVKLQPLQGHRFQPTGFPDLGPARYTVPGGTEMLLLESNQSVANHMEMAYWVAMKNLNELPYISVVDKNNKEITNSILEAHRINSEYIMKNAKRILSTNGKNELSKDDFNKEFAHEINYTKDGRVNWRKFYDALFKYDVNSLIHGTFLEEIGGRLRITRALSGFIEARGINVAESGGVKNNDVQPELKEGEGNVPYHRTEFTAESINAYFNLDLSLLRSYSFPEQALKLLVALSLFKIRRFLSTGLRLRTACDLEPVGDIDIRRPEGFKIPDEESLLDGCKKQISACAQAGLFADPSVTQVQWEGKLKKSKANSEEE